MQRFYGTGTSGMGTFHTHPTTGSIALRLFDTRWLQRDRFII
jgi:hypothetical protein